jgi:hypothetical protein
MKEILSVRRAEYGKKLAEITCETRSENQSRRPLPVLTRGHWGLIEKCYKHIPYNSTIRSIVR